MGPALARIPTKAAAAHHAEKSLLIRIVSPFLMWQNNRFNLLGRQLQWVCGAAKDSSEGNSRISTTWYSVAAKREGCLGSGRRVALILLTLAIRRTPPIY